VMGIGVLSSMVNVATEIGAGRDISYTWEGMLRILNAGISTFDRNH